MGVDENSAETLTVAHFAALVGQSFRFEAARCVLTLDHIVREGAAGQARPFILIFRGPRDGAPMPEGIYDCEAASGARFSLYVAPIHTLAPDRQDYQAVFN